MLPRRSMYVAWARVLGHDFEQLVRDTAQNHHTLIDRYGATNPAEFFAVATETFFEKPRQLRSKHPELYLQLQQFYHQDPASLDDRSHLHPPDPERAARLDQTLVALRQVVCRDTSRFFAMRAVIAQTMQPFPPDHLRSSEATSPLG